MGILNPNSKKVCYLDKNTIIKKLNDIKAISELTQLTYLNRGSNQISDTEPLANLTTPFPL